MPTTLPDVAARTRHQRQRLLAEFLSIVAAAFFLLLLVRGATGVATDVGALFSTDQRQDGLGGVTAYNPMEHVGRRPQR